MGIQKNTREYRSIQGNIGGNRKKKWGNEYKWEREKQLTIHVYKLR